MTDRNHKTTTITAPNETSSLFGWVVLWLKLLFHRLFHWISQFGHREHHNEKEEEKKETFEIESEGDTEIPEHEECEGSTLDDTTILVLKRIRLRARRRIAGFVIPWMLSLRTLRCLFAPPLPRPLPPFPRPDIV